MTAPRTRLSEGATDFEQDLLRSWGEQGPSARARQRALGLAGAGGALGATTSAAGAAGGAAAPVAAAKVTVGGLAIVKWGLSAVVLAGGVTVATVHLRAPDRSSAPHEAVVAAPHVASAGVVAVAFAPSTPTAQPDLPPPAAAVEPLVRANPVDVPRSTLPSKQPSPLAPARAPAPHAAASAAPLASEVPAPPPPASARAASVLGDEVASMDRSRAALAAGDAAGALRMLDEYDARFASGLLSQESAVLRVEALAKQGSARAAKELGDRFLAEHPTSPHAARVRALLRALPIP